MRGAVVAAFRRALAAFILLFGIVALLFLVEYSAKPATLGIVPPGTPGPFGFLHLMRWDIPVLTAVAVAALVVALLLYKQRARD